MLLYISLSILSLPGTYTQHFDILFALFSWIPPLSSTAPLFFSFLFSLRCSLLIFGSYLFSSFKTRPIRKLFSFLFFLFFLTLRTVSLFTLKLMEKKKLVPLWSRANLKKRSNYCVIPTTEQPDCLLLDFTSPFCFFFFVFLFSSVQRLLLNTLVCPQSFICFYFSLGLGFSFLSLLFPIIGFYYYQVRFCSFHIYNYHHIYSS